MDGAILNPVQALRHTGHGPEDMWSHNALAKATCKQNLVQALRPHSSRVAIKEPQRYPGVQIDSVTPILTYPYNGGFTQYSVVKSHRWSHRPQGYYRRMLRHSYPVKRCRARDI